MRKILYVIDHSASDKPSFAVASTFVLNQYEFLAAATRQGVMDEHLLEETLKSVICGLVKTYAPFIRHVRKDNSHYFENLVWLYYRFSGDDSLELGIMPNQTWGIWFGKLMGTQPYSA